MPGRPLRLKNWAMMMTLWRTVLGDIPPFFNFTTKSLRSSTEIASSVWQTKSFAKRFRTASYLRNVLGFLRVWIWSRYRSINACNGAFFTSSVCNRGAMMPLASAPSSACFLRWTSSAWATVVPAGRRRRLLFSRHSMK